MFKSQLSKCYKIQTEKSISEIFLDISNKIEIQKQNKKNFSNYIIDYNSFKICKNKIEVDRWMSIFNPGRGLGTLYFNFKENNEGTLIECECKPSNAILIIIIFLLFFLTLLTVLILWITKELSFQTITFLALSWLAGVGCPLLGLLYHRNALKEHSIAILNDLDINNQ